LKLETGNWKLKILSHIQPQHRLLGSFVMFVKLQGFVYKGLETRLAAYFNILYRWRPPGSRTSSWLPGNTRLSAEGNPL
jgi:hypothetical protein